MRKVLSITMAALMLLSLVACGGSDKEPESTPEPTPAAEPTPEPTPEPTEEPEDSTDKDGDGILDSGTYTLPCGVELDFSPKVRNDTTGNWRFSATAYNVPPADFAFEYYQMMFSSDDEIHAIWNATLGTMTRVSVMSGLLFVDTMEYVDGEQHDANLLFSGMLLDSRVLDAATGEEVEL